MNTERIILAGGSGFLGRVLATHYARRGHEVVILTRRPGPDDGRIRQLGWDGENPGAWMEALEGAAAVINLAGRSVDCRYTPANRRRILESRVNSTRALGHAITRCRRPPRVWLNSSTATLYRHTFGAAWDEDGDIAATPGAKDAFSIEVGQAWESALAQAHTPGTRKLALRSAMVLGLGANSVFPVLRRLVRLGLGGRMGTGRQFVSWIHEADFCRALDWLLEHEDASGPVNLAAPNALPNAAMMDVLREICGAPFGLGLPATAWMLELGAIFLRTETELILKSRRVAPGKLLAGGFAFQFATLREAALDLEGRRQA